MGEFGRNPINIIIKTRIISFWNRLITGKTSKLSYLIYRYMLSQSNTEYKWLKNVKNILTSVGRPDIWLNQDQLTSTGISNVIKQTLIDQYKQSWSTQQDSHKSRNYFCFKDTHCFESYFKIFDFNEAIDLFRFRTANFKLPLEKLRYESVP